MKKIISMIMCVMVMLSIQPSIADSDKKEKKKKEIAAPYTLTKEKLAALTPEQALQLLIDGNKRFTESKPIARNLLKQAKITSDMGQFPASVILSCMDSRGSTELIFDQGIGDIFSVRDAGNVIDADQLGGLEFATKVRGAKLIVVLGHTRCGAVAGACNNVELGNLTQLLKKIQPAVQTVKDQSNNKLDCNDYTMVDAIAKQNVINMMKQIMDQSPTIRELVNDKKVIIEGAMHLLSSGKVIFFNDTGTEVES